MGVKQNPSSHVDGMKAFDHCRYDENESDSEAEVDLRGLKHVEQVENSDGVYWLQDNTRSSYVIFPIPGRASADALRKFLGEKLHPNLITDEYGIVTTVAEISDDHLPTLQAQLWLDSKHGRAKTRLQPMSLHNQVRGCDPAVQHAPHSTPSSAVGALMAQEALLVACHITFIAELLESNYIFVLRKKAGGACEFPKCRTRSDDQSLLSTYVTIEPLVHWATITPVVDDLLCGGHFQTFRRDGEKCDDPLWSQALKQIMPKHPASYCSACLEMLFDNRTHAWAAVQRKGPASFTAINQCQPALHIKGLKIGHGLQGNSENRIALQRSPSMSNAATRSDGYPTPYDSAIDQTMAASFSLDGACDTPPKNYNSGGSFNSTINSQDLAGRDNGEEVASSSAKLINSTTEGLPSQTPFTPASAMSCEATTSHCSRTATSTWTTTNQIPYLPASPLTDHFYFNSNNQSTSEPEGKTPGDNSTKTFRKHQNLIHTKATSNSFTPDQSTKRKFGRELDTNTVLKAPKKPMSAALEMRIRKKDANGTADIRDFLHSAIKTPPNPANHSPRDEDSLLPILTYRDRSPSWETTEEDLEIPNENEPILPTPKVTPPRKTKRLTKKKSPPPKASKPAASKAGAQPAPALFFAKRIPVAAPDTISENIHAEHQARQPSAKEIICLCSKPARTHDVMLAQCSNTDCVIGWYHYDCLDKPGKISCRHGRWICQHCKNASHFRGLEKQNGWSVEKMMESEVAMPFTAQEMQAEMPNLGGGMGIVNPYGFGIVQEQDKPMFTPMPGALGSLAFLGYAESSPYAVKEAYTATRALVDRRQVDREYEAYGDEEDYYYDDEYEYDYEEGYGDGGEENMQQDIDVE